MALTDIVFDTETSVASRGNVGVISDSTINSHTLELSVPVVGDVKLATVYGPQDSLTGTLVTGGGGGSGYSRGRVVNA